MGDLLDTHVVGILLKKEDVFLVDAIAQFKVKDRRRDVEGAERSRLQLVHLVLPAAGAGVIGVSLVDENGKLLDADSLLQQVVKLLELDVVTQDDEYLARLQQNG